MPKNDNLLALYADLKMRKAPPQRTPLFFDFEFTGLVQRTTPISLGIASLDGAEFYAEFNDYNPDLVDDWIKENVIRNLTYPSNVESAFKQDSYSLINIKTNTTYVAKALRTWLSSFDSEIEFWGDCLAYDWVLFCELFDGARNAPSNIYYIPFDICTLFRTKGIDPDISRAEFVGVDGNFVRHNSLDDAKTIMACWQRMTQNPFM